ncbi:hypothetical protein [Vibrio phage YC]|uniref:Uncharacterized protein n=1 Tax=Vibrio phage YC TaxID=2267403 RepID=A0A384ZSC9_9CAUD|nr:antimicrobial peptide resistance and lipid A acylation protein PagP [Vibrio phage YC]AXC34537.1 hypothetical protein [Vibrio phage YC]QJT71433.1 hypothetical protein GR28A_00145 [Vibrio phage vB_VcorM_GR28A]
MKRKLLAATLALTSLTATAGITDFGDFSKAEPTLILGATSIHHDSWSREHLNQQHPSIGIEMWDISVTYVEKNSWNEASIYAAWTPEFYESEYVDLSFALGFATGYHADNKVIDEHGKTWKMDEKYANDLGVIPLIGISAKVNLTENVHMDVNVTPMVTMFNLGLDF